MLFRSEMQEILAHLIERVGAKLRAMMPWSEEGKAHAAGDGAPARERAGAAATG